MLTIALNHYKTRTKSREEIKKGLIIYIQGLKNPVTNQKGTKSEKNIKNTECRYGAGA